MAGVRKSMPEMQKFSTFRVLFLAILYFKAGKEARCSFFILQRALSAFFNIPGQTKEALHRIALLAVLRQRHAITP
jgi:hypothetical protein